MTATTIDPNYQMRGPRVHPLDIDDIDYIGERAKNIFRLSKRGFSSGKAEQTASKFENYGIYIDVVADSEWIPATRANVDPTIGMIYMPQKLYDELCRGKVEAIRIFLHEVGHIVLGHRPLLYFTDNQQKPTKEEDSEWQADAFADAILKLLKLPKEEAQLEFKF